MIRICTVLLQLCLVVGVRVHRSSTNATEVRDYSGFVVLKAEPKTSDELSMLSEEVFADQSLEVDFWAEPLMTGVPVVMMVDRKSATGVKKYLDSVGISYYTSIPDVQAAVYASAPVGTAASFSLTQYNRFDPIMTWLDQKISSSSGKPITIGNTYEGRTVRGVKFNAGKSLPIIFMMCGLHAREWISPASCIYIIDQFAQGRVSGAADAFEWHIVPVANADGYEYTHVADRMWRKTRSPAQNWWCQDGVDPNRNWDIAHCQESRERSCRSDSYCGKAPFTESEPRNIADYVSGLQKSGREVKAFLDVHAFSQLWLWPYGYSTSQSPDEEEIARCGNAAASALAGVHGLTFTRGPISTTIYKASGSAVDYVYEKLGIKYAYAPELRDTGNYGFLLPPNQILPSGKELLVGLQAMAACISR